MSGVYCSNGCGASEDLDVAVDGGEWLPCFWDDASASEVGPICPACRVSLGVVWDTDNGYWHRPLEVCRG